MKFLLGRLARLSVFQAHFARLAHQPSAGVLPQGQVNGPLLKRRYGVTLRAKGFKQSRQACSDELQPT